MTTHTNAVCPDPAAPPADNPLLAFTGSDALTSAMAGYARGVITSAHFSLLDILNLQGPMPAELRAKLQIQEQELRLARINLLGALAADSADQAVRCANNPRLGDIADRAAARAREAQAEALLLRTGSRPESAAP